MQYLDEFLLIAIAHFFAVASPGPDFAIVLKQSIQQGRKNALWTSAGVGAAILLHIAYCVLGVALILSQSPSLFMALKYLAGAYLAYLGVQALRSAKPSDSKQQTLAPAEPESVYKAFRRGFFTNALNPKATLFFIVVNSELSRCSGFIWIIATWSCEYCFTVMIWYTCFKRSAMNMLKIPVEWQ